MIWILLVVLPALTILFLQTVFTIEERLNNENH
jgi:hypothetical protein